MVSLKNYPRETLKNEIKHRFEKIANMLDDTDFDDYLNETITYLSETLYNPRSVIFQEDDMITIENGNGTFVDVTPLKIDAINRVYYADRQYLNTSFMDDIGLMPFIAKASGLMSSIADVTNYINLQSNFNSLNRQMELIDDFELMPVDSKGRQLLQLRNKGLTWVEFLPMIDYSDDSWLLFDHEYAMVKKLAFALLNRANAEMQFSASALGIGSEAKSILDYWDNKIKEIKEDWMNHQIITALY